LKFVSINTATNYILYATLARAPPQCAWAFNNILNYRETPENERKFCRKSVVFGNHAHATTHISLVGSLHLHMSVCPGDTAELQKHLIYTSYRHIQAVFADVLYGQPPF